MTANLLSGVKIVSLALNLPGPAAAQELVKLGAHVLKIEPPNGDPFQTHCQEWYNEMHRNIETRRVNLRDQSGRDFLEEALRASHFLLTSSRLDTLRRLQLDWSNLHRRHPHICHVAIVGFSGERESLPGHDLNYQGTSGLLEPPKMPISLIADLSGAQKVLSTALAILLAKLTGQGSRYAEVSLADSAAFFTLPIKYGLTNSNALLGGSRARYNLYRAKDGWLALAALEEHFWRRLCSLLGLDEDGLEEKSHLAEIFLKRNAADWQEWAEVNNLPLTRVKPFGSFEDDAKHDLEMKKD